MAKRKYRVVILGAGFSKPAGLPLAEELWNQTLARNKLLGEAASFLNDDLDAYISFRRDCDDVGLTAETINYEEFLGFLDIEHYLRLRGPDTWSEDGNEAQVVIKTLIGQILTEKMPSPIPELYLEFARRLQPNDYVLTFNYDVLLERALDAVGKAYRLFPFRYASVSRDGGIVDLSREEITILKLHGSIDWFDKSQYLNSLQTHQERRVQEPLWHPVFNGISDWGVSRVVDGPRYENDPLLNMYRVTNIEGFYKQNIMLRATPWILPPSTYKVVYARALEQFWREIGVSGGTNFGLAIVGYSLPSQDLYARQAIYSLVKNYQEIDWELEVSAGLKKTPLVLVDQKDTAEKLEEFRKNYRFVDFNKANLYMNGFDEEAVNKIFV